MLLDYWSDVRAIWAWELAALFWLIILIFDVITIWSSGYLILKADNVAKLLRKDRMFSDTTPMYAIVGACIGIVFYGSMFVFWMTPWKVMLNWIFFLVPIAALAQALYRTWTSVESQAARAKRKHSTSRTLSIYASADKADDVVAHIQEILPHSAVRQALIGAVTEVLALKSSAVGARARGVSGSVTTGIVAEADQIAGALWVKADRLALVASQNLPDTALSARMDREVENLERLAESTREVRVGIAEALLSGGASAYLEAAQGGLRNLASIARTLE